MSTYWQNIARLIRIALPGVVAVLGRGVSRGIVAAMARHGDVELAIQVMGSMIAPQIRNWLPGLRAARGPIGPVSTLRSRQGCAT
jgi:hypothetical protein